MGGHPGSHPHGAGMATPERGAAAGAAMPKMNFDHCPFLVIWETTRSCGLACKHCRAAAQLGRDPEELTTDEGKRLLDHVAAMGTPIVILSGGDPLNRPDLEELVRHAKQRGLRVGTIPAATQNLTRERIHALKEAGVDQIAFSLDAPRADLHDGFRRVEGSFQKTLEGVGFARAEGLPLQINTCFASWNAEHLEDMIQLVSGLGIVFWEVFFLIPTGRGKEMEGLTPAQFEQAFDRLHRLTSEVPFIVKVTEAPHYRRFVIQRERAAVGESHDGRVASEADASGRIRHILARPRGVQGSLGMSPQAVNAGKGFLFVDHVGQICPSGFLPLPVGHVRRDDLADIYRHAMVFQDLRNPSRLKGKCGRCEYASMCSGSRARAYALTGDFLAEDPSCAYQPAIRSSFATRHSSFAAEEVSHV